MPTGQITNITNKNVLFKFKKNGNQIKNGSQQQVMVSQGNMQNIVDLKNSTNFQSQNSISPNVAMNSQKQQNRRGNNGFQKVGSN